MELEQLNYLAVNNPKFTPFNVLMPGRFGIEKFFFGKDEKFSSGTRLCALIDKGERYVMLPKKMMMTPAGKPVELEKLNEKKYDLIFEGKADKFDLKFHFALSDGTETNEVIVKAAA